MRTVVVLDYGSGNIRSAERAVARAGAEVTVTTDAQLAIAADGLVVPGVGAFAACMAGLQAVGGPEIIATRRDSARPTLAICVGHQVMFEAGIEHGVRTEGCGIWPGVVEQLHAPRLPHMGWNTIEAATGSQLFAGISSERFYFVHSYGVRTVPMAPQWRATWAEHGGDRFVAAVEDGPLWSTQFHPEKSGDAGARLIANWVATL
ncbi:MAG TPA: imidazole glycerol phosphate synthase subunit HisH [Propionibacteriaceae bacterium]|nr:imidazole glycerol phosphate synthase subunit HisH [Propionibacteriaceae bacterium]